ncbi:MAG: hypothetical protein GY713_09995 [Actinomycetia bacterium]|nr:hypothetical protein [Actinomycetes bacterium]
MTLTDTPASGRLSADDETAALEQLHELGCTDGLPVVIPTAQRVERMVLATGYDGDMVLGEMGPNLGACTIEKLATVAVMAGCTPDHVPVVVAAAKAVIDPRFDLTEMQATTHSIAPLIIVNGPARQWCGGVHGGYGALGPGYRANASIGRALRLAMINVGGARAGSSDMALMGHGGKFTFCLAEDEESSPWSPMHTDHGFEAHQSTVTVIGTDAPHSVIGVLDADDTTSADRFITSLSLSFANVATNNAALRGGQAALAVNPTHAMAMADAGFDRADIAAAIWERAGNTGADLMKSAAAMGSVDADRFYACFEEPADIHVFVAGGGGLYSVAFPSWCAGPHKNRAVTIEIEVGQACEIPGLSDLKHS